MSTPANIPILIVGAGPTGLALAHSLQREGVSFRLIDKSPGRSSTSRALGIHARTLEMLDAMGLVDRFLAQGRKVRGVGFHEGGKLLGEISLAHIGSSYSHALILPQSKTEEIFDRVLADAGVVAERPCELLGMRQERGVVLCRLRDAQDMIEELPFDYVVGCDGAHSTVRHCSGIEFDGGGYAENFGLADVELRGEIAGDQISLFFHPDGLVAFFPMRPGFFRIVAQLHGGAADNGVTVEELEEVIRARAGDSLRLGTPEWITAFRTHHRRARTFRDGRVFLAGDAAHIHSPAGAQGMNTGLQDAWNLGWKLAAVVKGNAAPGLLLSYEEERMPAADHVLQMTDRMMRSACLKEPLATTLRNQLLSLGSRVEPLETRFAREISQVALNYRASSLTQDCRHKLPLPGSLRAGDRLPDVELIGPDGRRQNLYSQIRKPGFQLFVAPATAELYGKGCYSEVAHFVGRIKKDFGENLQVHWVLTPMQSTKLRDRIPEHWVDLGGTVSHTLGIQPCGVALVRPDYYIGFLSNDFNEGTLRLSTLSFWI